MYFDEKSISKVQRAQKAESVVTHIVVQGDTLTNLSQKYYGTMKRWIEIFKLNEDRVSDPSIIRVGQELKIKTEGKEVSQAVEYVPTGEVMVIADPTLGFVSKAVHKDAAGALEAGVSEYDGKKVLRAEAFRNAKLEFKFDVTRLEVRVKAPPEQKRTRSYNLGLTPTVFNEQDTVKPEPFSIYTNLYGYKNHDTSLVSQQSGTLSIDSAMNVYGYVLEGSGTYTEDTRPTFTREGTRLVKDFPGAMVRSTLGDLNYPVSHYQRFRSLGGISITRNFTLQPYKNVYPAPSRELLLTSPSVVTVIQNGQRVRIFDLPPGRHLLENLPVVSGIGLIELEIKDPAGRTEIIPIPMTLSSQLLQKDLHAYSYNAGFKSKSEGGDILYDKDNALFTLYHRYGVTDRFTLGLSAESDRRHQTPGLEMIFSTYFGAFGFNIARSKAEGVDDGTAARLSYTYEDFRATNSANRFFAVSVEEIGKTFTLGDDIPPNNPNHYILNANYGQRLFWDINGGLFGSYNSAWLDIPGNTDSYAYGTTFSKVLANAMSFNLILTERRSTAGPSSFDAEFFFSWNFTRDQNVSVRTLSSDSSTTASYRANLPSTGPNRYVVTAEGRTKPENDRGSLALNYAGNRGQIELLHSQTQYRRDIQETISSASFNTGFGFVGGKLGWGPAVYDSFAVVTRPSHWLDQAFAVNPKEGDRAEAEVNSFGPALVTNLQSYQYALVAFDNSQIKEGYQFSPNSYILHPTYKSGILLRPGTDSTVFGEGVMIGADGAPVPLASGEFISKTGKPSEFFTNTVGKFVVEGLNPGEYVVRFHERAYQEFRLTIPDDARGAHNLGEIKITPRGN